MNYSIFLRIAVIEKLLYDFMYLSQRTFAKNSFQKYCDKKKCGIIL
jgi:hypothetical protein